jgi:hypothetical protein
MAFNGSGTYVLPAGNPVLTGTTISTSWANTTLSDLGSALSNCVTRDGQSPATANLPMGSFKIAGLAAATANGDAVRYEQVPFLAGTPLPVASGGTGAATLTANNVLLGNGTSTPQAVAPGTSGNVLTSNGTTWQSTALPAAATVRATINGRLTLTSATPVTSTDVLAATTIYFTPYNGNQIATYSGSAWSISTFTEKSVAVPATTSTPFDVFIVDATLALETVNWTNDTTRATALVLQDGIYVKSGATTRRYLGTGRTTTVSGQCEDSLVKRYLWNVSNRLIRNMLVNDLTGTWTYTTNTMRQANGSTANQLDFVIGLSEVPVLADLQCAVRNIGGSANLAVAIGLDVTNDTKSNVTGLVAYGTNVRLLRAVYTGYPSAGRHFLAWLEVSEVTGTTTWYGATRGSFLGGTSNIDLRSGITGTIYG